MWLVETAITLYFNFKAKLIYEDNPKKQYELYFIESKTKLLASNLLNSQIEITEKGH